MPPDSWYGNEGRRANARGFEYVTGICRFVRTLEYEKDLCSIEELLIELLIL
jgi:hypothetical protein